MTPELMQSVRRNARLLIAIVRAKGGVSTRLDIFRAMQTPSGGWMNNGEVTDALRYLQGEGAITYEIEPEGYFDSSTTVIRAKFCMKPLGLHSDLLAALERIAAQDYSGQTKSDGAHLADIAIEAINRHQGVCKA